MTNTKIIQKVNITQAALSGGNLANVTLIAQQRSSTSSPVIALEALLLVTPGPNRLDLILRKTVAAALNLFEGDKKKAAEFLGVSYGVIRRVDKNLPTCYASRKKLLPATTD